jgi:hypothetical protein
VSAARALAQAASKARSSTLAAASPLRRRRNAAELPSKALHVGVIGASSAFRHDPVDILRRILDVAGLAVNAILGVDLQSRAPAFFDIFVDAGRAITLLRPVIIGKIHFDRYYRILQRQVDRLVFLMIGVGEEDEESGRS